MFSSRASDKPLKPVLFGCRRYRVRWPAACLALILGMAGFVFGDEETPGPDDRDAWRKRIVALERILPENIPETPEAARYWAKSRLHLRKADFVLQRYRFGEWASAYIQKELSAAGSAMEILNGAPAPDPRPGLFEAAYWCDSDGSAQPFVGYIPSTYDHRTPHPLLVYLHGYSPLLNIINWAELSSDMLEAADQGGFLVVAPFARGNTDFQGIGEKDVMRVIHEMQQRYRVAPDRIILAGYSMGGMGAWTLAAHYPHRFAGALIVSGRACYYTWHGVERESLPFYKQAFIDMEFGHSLLPNLRNMPVLCYHGEADPLIPVSEARTMATALQPLNPAFEFIEIEGAEHWIFDRVMRKPHVRHWLGTLRRQPPETFTYVSWHPRYHQAHWLSLPADESHGVRRQVSVTATDEGTWEVNADKVDIVRLHPDRLPATMSPEMIHAAPGITLLAVEEHDQASTYKPSRGPIKEFFLAPFMFVQAGNDAPDPMATARFAERSREWLQYAQALPRRARETELSALQKQLNNLFLFGEPEHSPMIREVLEHASIRITETHYVIGEQTIPRDGHGLLFVYQSPWNPERLVAIQCGLPWGQHLSVNHRYDYLPDLIVYNAMADADRSNQALLAGFFDKTWSLQTETLYIRPTEHRP